MTTTGKMVMGTGFIEQSGGKELPITVETVTGTVITIHATEETISGYYGSVNKLVNDWVKPLQDVAKITVIAYDDFFEEDVPVITYSKELEEWKTRGERIVITYDFFGIGIEDEDRGYLDVIDGWLPKYALRYQKNAKKKHVIASEDIKRIETAKEVNYRAKLARNIKRYYKDPQTWNMACMVRRQMRQMEEQATN